MRKALLLLWWADPAATVSAMSFITLIGSAFRAGMLAAFLLMVGVAVTA
jgi:hypothetical protein